MLEVVSGHMVKWLCRAVTSIISVMCPRWVRTGNLKKVFFFKITSRHKTWAGTGQEDDRTKRRVEKLHRHSFDVTETTLAGQTSMVTNYKLWVLLRGNLKTPVFVLCVCLLAGLIIVVLALRQAITWPRSSEMVRNILATKTIQMTFLLRVVSLRDLKHVPGPGESQPK